jgi:hypothetical protein
MCCCYLDELISLSKQERNLYVINQWQCIDWKTVENRIICLSEPLDLFEEMADCSDGTCQTF